MQNIYSADNPPPTNETPVDPSVQELDELTQRLTENPEEIEKRQPERVNNRSKLFTFASILVLILVFGAIGFNEWQKSQINDTQELDEPQEENTEKDEYKTEDSQNETLGNQEDSSIKLKDYYNEDVGFSIKLTHDLEVFFNDNKTVEFATIPPMDQPFLTITKKLTNKDLETCKSDLTNTPCMISNIKNENQIKNVTSANMSAQRFNIYRTSARKEEITQLNSQPIIEFRILTNEGYGDPRNLDNILSTFKFIEESSEGKFCGGIANLPCPTGYSCILEGKYPDAGGNCIKD